MVLYHRSIVEREAHVVINYLKEGSKLREQLDKAKTVLLSRTLLHAIDVYGDKFKNWFLDNIISNESLPKVSRKHSISELRLKFRSLLKEGKVRIGEEDLESIGRLIDGVRFIDEILASYPSARELESRYSYGLPTLALAGAFGILFSYYIADYVTLFVMASLGAFFYYGVFSKYIEKIRWARKHLSSLESKTSIEEVIRYVLKASSEEA